MAGSTVLSTHLDSLTNSILDLTQIATPCRYRLVDCEQLIIYNNLRILEFFEFPAVPYTTISYVWHGNPFDDTKDEDLGAFTVKGAEDGDRIGIHVLRHMCRASLVQEAKFMWLDRLCIMQTTREDKGWQMSQMFRIYKSCKACIILPSGIRGLAHLDEGTTWLHRGWTLQEVMAPPRAFVLFAWVHGVGIFQNTNYPDVYEVERRKSAIARVEVILQACRARVRFTTRERKEVIDHVNAKLFGATRGDYAAVDALTGMMETSDPEEKAYSIWRSSFMRTSSRPVDMIFSIMGLFDVSLDPLAFQSHDRIGATIALTQELLRKGYSASWLGISFDLPPSKLLAFPEFPTTSVDGMAKVQIKNEWKKVTEVVDGMHWFKDAPKGRMDNDGYLIFSAKAAPLRQCTGREGKGIHLKAQDGSSWEVVTENLNRGKPQVSTETVKAIAVMVGRRVHYNHGWRSVYREIDPHTFSALLIRDHEPGKFHIVSYIHGADSLQKVFENWEDREFAVGGIEGTKVSVMDVRLTRFQTYINAEQ
ncbi:hypothetical protein OBBRIDRAFT_889859 [Obba rivulosa]|uniref:Heterokaryon incompatibility domain-containing protein n=1 Tax=Obba rivulosa TaxID=1052685 RepID=A0A8E2AMF1_9APHY|nr:hypothetical protein OBBRIDRAFT_889859 [Obba rivulosa]